MLGKLGSPRVNKRILDTNSQASIDYEDIEEESHESMRVKYAKNQIKKLSKNFD